MIDKSILIEQRAYFRALKDALRVVELELEAYEGDSDTFETGGGIAAACNSLVMHYYTLQSLEKVQKRTGK